MTIEESEREGVFDIARRAHKASRYLRAVGGADRRTLLQSMAAAIEESMEAIIQANILDMSRGKEKGLGATALDRLLLDDLRLSNIASAVRQVASLPDPLGEVVHGSRLANGLNLRQIRVPMGVIGMIYEARPNVTVDAAVLSLKAGSAVILRGGSAAIETNATLVRVMRDTLKKQGFPQDLVQTIDPYGRDGTLALMRARGLVDVVIPRGGANLIQTVVTESLVPVIETGVGNCHVYVDAAADLEKALAIAINAKTQRPGVCNAAETLLVHAQVAQTFLPQVLKSLGCAGVVVHADQRTAQLAPPDIKVFAATEEDWGREYLGLEMAVRVVDSLDEAIEHIRVYSTGHTEAIVSDDVKAINRFVAGVDSAAIMVNASTRFTDGNELGLGAEIGISTQKLHARGPMGLKELTTTTWVVEGEGHVRN